MGTNLQGREIDRVLLLGETDITIVDHISGPYPQIDKRDKMVLDYKLPIGFMGMGRGPPLKLTDIPKEKILKKLYLMNGKIYQVILFGLDKKSFTTTVNLELEMDKKILDVQNKKKDDYIVRLEDFIDDIGHRRKISDEQIDMMRRIMGYKPPEKTTPSMIPKKKVKKL